MDRYKVIYEEGLSNILYAETVPHIWLCTRSLLNFLIFEEYFLFFFNSVRTCFVKDMKLLIAIDILRYITADPKMRPSVNWICLTQRIMILLLNGSLRWIILIFPYKGKAYGIKFLLGVYAIQDPPLCCSTILYLQLCWLMLMLKWSKNILFCTAVFKNCSTKPVFLSFQSTFPLKTKRAERYWKVINLARV